MASLFIPGYPEVSSIVAGLHSLLPYDPHAQIKIDAYLPCGAAAHQNLSLRGLTVSSLVLLPEDAPQLGTLPDLGPVFRACIVAKQWGASLLAHTLHGCFPCPRPPLRGPPDADSASVAALVNILLGSLLGLYPGCIKRPPFPTRSAVYGRVHAVLASGAEGMAAFVRKYPALFSLALSEYVCHVLPLFFPAEFEGLVDSCPVAPFFAAGPALFDQFRQDHLDTGDEPWGALAVAAAQVNERMGRVFRSKCRQPAPFLRRVPGGEASMRELLAALSCPRITSYPCHKVDATMLRGEYAVLLGGQQLADVALLHGLVQIHALPPNVRALQQLVIDGMRQRCQRQARLRRTKHLCLLCERRGRKGVPRLCSRTFGVVCQSCGDNPDSMLAIDMIGRVVTIQGRHYVFAPCCGTVQEYTGSGRDFQQMPWPRAYGGSGQDFRLAPCPHGLPPVSGGEDRVVYLPCCGKLVEACDAKGAHCPVCRAPREDPGSKRGRPICAICGGVSLPRAHECLNHVTARLGSVHLCQRHTPPEEWLRGVSTRRQFDQVCQDWECRARGTGRGGRG